MKNSKNIPKTFISFLIAAFLIWLLITFSKEYSTVVTYTVNYTKIPQSKLLLKAQENTIDLTVKATGFKLLSSNFTSKTINIECAGLQKKRNSKFYLLPKNQFIKIQKQLISGIELQEISKDTIYLNLGLLKSKKVALKPNLNIKYQIGYDLLGDIKITPDSIVISGSEQNLSKITHLNLEPIKFNNLKENFVKSVKILQPNKNEKFKFSALKTKVSGKIERFTEGTLQIPFSIKNLPENINLTTLSHKVEVVYIVSLSNFSKVTEASFQVECDYEITEKNKLSFIIPKVITKPDFIKSFKIVPTKIDFLIQK